MRAKKRLPCAENVSTLRLFGDNALANLQRGFDFYSWLTFLALNAPADGSRIDNAKPNTPTKWEQSSNFKQLLDVMREDGKASKWEDKKIVPPECLDSIQQIERQGDGHRDDRGKLQRAVQDRTCDRPARQLCDLRHSDEQVDVRVHSGAQPAEQSRTTEQRKRLVESRFPGGSEQAASAIPARS